MEPSPQTTKELPTVRWTLPLCADQDSLKFGQGCSAFRTNVSLTEFTAPGCVADKVDKPIILVALTTLASFVTVLVGVQTDIPSYTNT